MVAHRQDAVGVRRERLIAPDHRADQRVGAQAEPLDRPPLGRRLLLHDHLQRLRLALRQLEHRDDAPAAHVLQDHAGGQQPRADRGVDPERADERDQILPLEQGDRLLRAVALAEEPGQEVRGVVVGERGDRVRRADALLHQELDVRAVAVDDPGAARARA